MPDQLSFAVDAPPEVVRLRALLGEEWPAIMAARERSAGVRDRLLRELGGLVPTDASLVVFGSLARHEFTEGSDVDWSLLVDGPADPQHLDAALAVERRLKELGFREPGREGTFQGLAISHDLIHKIGGADDTNRNTTQRILLLLESAPVGPSVAYDNVVRNVLRRYIQEDLLGADSPFKVPRFLQNDVARYWRTMAVDFAYKRRLRGGSGWALRTAKLRMSRKLMYAAGLLSCFACEVDFPPEERGDAGRGMHRVIRHLADLVARSPLDIVARAALQFPDALAEPARRLFGAYDEFLALLDRPELRGRLDELSPEAADRDELYASVRRMGERVQEGLDGMFFESDTPFPRLTRKYGVF